MNYIYEQIEEIKESLKSDTGNENYFLCQDKAEIQVILSEGKIVLYLSPPEIEFVTWNLTQTYFDLWIIHPDQVDEKQSLQEIIEIIKNISIPSGYAVRKASPAMWASGYPAYVLKID